MKIHFESMVKSQLSTLLVLTGIFIVSFFSLDRSMWIDEAMLYINLAETQLVQIIQPLPYFNQASPVLPLAIQMLAHQLLGPDFYGLRLLNLCISLFALTVFVANLPKEIPKHFWLAFLTLSIGTFAYFSTELKHYSYEFSASLFLLITYFSYINQEYFKGFVYSMMALLLGFSNIIPLGVILGFVFLYHLKQQTLNTQFIRYCLISGLTLLLAYISMKYLTDQQISSYEVYQSKGFLGDTKALIGTIYVSHGMFLSLLLILLIPISILKGKAQPTLQTFTLFYLGLTLAIFILKITALYPAISGRHIYWLLPFSITMATLTLQLLVEQYRLNQPLLFMVFISIFTINAYQYIHNHEHTANHALIDKITSLCSKKNVALISAPNTDQIRYTYQNRYDDSCFTSNIDIDNKGDFYQHLMERLELFDQSKHNYLVLSHFDITNTGHPYYKWLHEALQLKQLAYEIHYQNTNVLIISMFKKHANHQ